MRSVLSVLLVISLFCTVGCAGGSNAPTSFSLSAPVSSERSLDNAPIIRRIVVFKESVSEREKEEISASHAVLLKKLSLINATVVQLPPQASADAENKLKGDPRVLRVDEDIIVSASASAQEKPGDGTVQPPQSVPWGIDRVKAPMAWFYSTGNGVRVAILDTGIDLSHPDLQVYGGVNTINPTKSPKDDNGHGTHVAGTVDARN
ncbi:MAG: S8 family serine peptidase, partial [Armatimonadetes bacterium]|nr:S8 family serine peptidase [Armatimonadota bacterium]